MTTKTFKILLLIGLIQLITTCGPCEPIIHSYDVKSITVGYVDYNLSRLPDSSSVNQDSVSIRCLLNGIEYTRKKTAWISFGSKAYATTTCNDYEDVNEGLVKKIKNFEIRCDKTIWGIDAGFPLDTSCYSIREYPFFGDYLTIDTLLDRFNNNGIALDKWGNGYGNSNFFICFKKQFNADIFYKFQIVLIMDNNDEIQSETQYIKIKNTQNNK